MITKGTTDVTIELLIAFSKQNRLNIIGDIQHNRMSYTAENCKAVRVRGKRIGKFIHDEVVGENLGMGMRVNFVELYPFGSYTVVRMQAVAYNTGMMNKAFAIVW